MFFFRIRRQLYPADHEIVQEIQKAQHSAEKQSGGGIDPRDAGAAQRTSVLQSIFQKNGGSARESGQIPAYSKTSK